MTDARRLAYLEEYLSSSSSIRGFAREKGLNPSCIRHWLRIFGLGTKPTAPMPKSNSLNEQELQEQIYSLQRQLKSMEVELRQSNLARDAYRRMVELAEKTYNIPIRKNSGAK